jgi:hypothetical protein
VLKQGRAGKSLMELEINKLAGEGRSGTHAQQSGAGKLVKVVGGKFHRRGGKTHFPCEL